MTTFDKSKNSGSPKQTPKVPISKGKSGNYMRESIHSDSNKSPMSPLKRKNLSK